MKDYSPELTTLIETALQKPSDVFYATRMVEGKLKAGYWYRVYEDDNRQRWVEFGFCGAGYSQAVAKIKGMK